MNCIWCSNPEGQKGKPELMVRKELCVACGACVNACPNQAVSLTDEGSVTDRTLCETCGECAKVCPSGARQIAGQEMTVDEVMDIIIKDEVFYRHSGGGVTASGGEPLIHSSFLSRLFERCKALDIGTAVETSGCVPWSNIERILPCTDVFLYDIKHIDLRKHQDYISKGNKRILNNLRHLGEAGSEVIVRIPVIPGFNSTTDELRGIISTAAQRCNVTQVDLLPYHCLGKPKYESLGRKYPLKDLEPLYMKEAKLLKSSLNSGDIRIEIEV